MQCETRINDSCDKSSIAKGKSVILVSCRFTASKEHYFSPHLFQQEAIFVNFRFIDILSKSSFSIMLYFLSARYNLFINQIAI